MDLLDEAHIQRTIAVTLLQIKDYLAAILVSMDDDKAKLSQISDTIESIHGSGNLFLGPPVLLDSSVEHHDD